MDDVPGMPRGDEGGTGYGYLKAAYEIHHGIPPGSPGA